MTNKEVPQHKTPEKIDSDINEEDAKEKASKEWLAAREIDLKNRIPLSKSPTIYQGRNRQMVKLTISIEEHLLQLNRERKPAYYVTAQKIAEQELHLYRNPNGHGNQQPLSINEQRIIAEHKARVIDTPSTEKKNPRVRAPLTEEERLMFASSDLKTYKIPEEHIEDNPDYIVDEFGYMVNERTGFTARKTDGTKIRTTRPFQAMDRKWYKPDGTCASEEEIAAELLRRLQVAEERKTAREKTKIESEAPKTPPKTKKQRKDSL